MRNPSEFCWIDVVIIDVWEHEKYIFSLHSAENPLTKIQRLGRPAMHFRFSAEDFSIRRTPMAIGRMVRWQFCALIEPVSSAQRPCANAPFDCIGSFHWIWFDYSARTIDTAIAGKCEFLNRLKSQIIAEHVSFCAIFSLVRFMFCVRCVNTHIHTRTERPWTMMQSKPFRLARLSRAESESRSPMLHNSDARLMQIECARATRAHTFTQRDESVDIFNGAEPASGLRWRLARVSVSDFCNMQREIMIQYFAIESHDVHHSFDLPLSHSFTRSLPLSLSFAHGSLSLRFNFFY